GGAPNARHAVEGGAADHRVLDVLEDLAVGVVLVMMRIHVDDEEILVVALARLLGRVLQVLLDRKLVEAQVADFTSWHVHGVLLPGDSNQGSVISPFGLPIPEFTRRRKCPRRGGRPRTCAVSAGGRRRTRRS